jgi:hypothetical protein
MFWVGQIGGINPLAFLTGEHRYSEGNLNPFAARPVIWVNSLPQSIFILLQIYKIQTMPHKTEAYFLLEHVSLITYRLQGEQ